MHLLSLPGTTGGTSIQNLCGAYSSGTLLNFDVTTEWGTGATESHPGGHGWLDFDNSDNLVSIKAHPAIRPDFPFSFSVWANLTDTSTFQVMLWNDSDPDSFIYSGMLFYRTDNNDLAVILGDGAGGGGGNRKTFQTTDQVVQQEWIFLTAVAHSFTNVNIYLNAVDLALDAPDGSGASMGYNGKNGSIGTGGGGNFPANGPMDDWRIYGYGLSGSDVEALYLESSRGYPDALNWIGRQHEVVTAPAAAAGSPGLMMLGNQFTGGMAG